MSSMLFQKLYTFLSSTNGFMDLSMIEECKILLGNLLGYDGLDANSNDFGYDFVYANA